MVDTKMEPSDEIESNDKKTRQEKKKKIPLKIDIAEKKIAYPFLDINSIQERSLNNEKEVQEVISSDVQRNEEESVESKFSYSYPFKTRNHLKSKLEIEKEFKEPETELEIPKDKELSEQNQKFREDGKIDYSYPFSKIKRKSFEKPKDPLSSYDYPFRTDFRRSRSKVKRS